ncbi:hypothetical protein X801_00056 [Opisthorchis viverrini]|uniref:Uncharacterized protein n=1 Tax=Opisthorchis viverrini TaxID=6198 RepID=A0A1S8XBE5_OPIVI|nr:hypothetical protein X801_00056 [Opisthorchis viverrini]
MIPYPVRPVEENKIQTATAEMRGRTSAAEDGLPAKMLVHMKVHLVLKCFELSNSVNRPTSFETTVRGTAFDFINNTALHWSKISMLHLMDSSALFAC